MKDSNLKTKGFPTLDELRRFGTYPSDEAFRKGPIAVIECIEEIPCNPCEETCIKGAIKIGKPITNLPRLNTTKCSGCSFCIANCPGLAIYIKDYTYSDKEALITFPYEFLPLPKVNEEVIAVNREGQSICKGRVIKVNTNKVNDKTTLISMVYPKEYFHDIVSIRRF